MEEERIYKVDPPVCLCQLRLQSAETCRVIFGFMIGVFISCGQSSNVFFV